MKIYSRKILVLFLLFLFVVAIPGCTSAKTDVDISEMFENETEIGVGEKQFRLAVIYDDGEISAYCVNTDKQTVGEALIDTGLIEGEAGPYGMYIKSVNGVEAEYNNGGKYWAFYIDGEYATSGVDSTDIEEERIYSLKVTD